MAYRIEYSYTATKPDSVNKPIHRTAALTAGFFIVFLLLVHACWPRGRQLLQDLLIPGDAETTIEAMEMFVDELRYGNSFTAAAEVFCREIITNADIH